MRKTMWFAIAILLMGCVPVQPQQDRQVTAGEIKNSVVVEQSNPAPTTPGAAKPGTVDIFGGDEAALRAFMARWFSSPYPGAPFQETKIYIGELPPDLGMALPLPPDARVLGSVEGYYQEYQILFDSELVVCKA